MEHVLQVFSIVILSCFCLEIALVLIAMGLLYFKSLGYIVDLIIVPVSLALELRYKVRVGCGFCCASEFAIFTPTYSLSVCQGIGGFLVIVRMWRMMRIMKKVTNARQERLVGAAAADKHACTQHTTHSRIRSQTHTRPTHTRTHTTPQYRKEKKLNMQLSNLQKNFMRSSDRLQVNLGDKVEAALLCCDVLVLSLPSPPVSGAPLPGASKHCYK